MQAKRLARVCAYLTQVSIEIRASINGLGVNTDVDFHPALFALNLFDAPAFRATLLVGGRGGVFLKCDQQLKRGWHLARCRKIILRTKSGGGSEVHSSPKHPSREKHFGLAGGAKAR